MKQRCISTHLHISILLCNSAPLRLNFLLDACRESAHLHMRKRSSVWGTPPHPPPPASNPSVFRYLFVYSSFALSVNNINVMVCCCRSGLNLHVSDDRDPQTEMLIVPAKLISILALQLWPMSLPVSLQPCYCTVSHSSTSSTIHPSP